MPEEPKENTLTDDYNEYDDDDPNNPDHPDYDLSEAGIGARDDYDPTPFFLRRGVILVVTVVIILALLVPLFNIL